MVLCKSSLAFESKLNNQVMSTHIMRLQAGPQIEQKQSGVSPSYKVF